MTTVATSTSKPADTAYTYSRTCMGVDDVFCIDDPEGNTILELHFWDEHDRPEEAIAEAKAKIIVAALNLKGGGWVQQPENVRSILAEQQCIADVWSFPDVWKIRSDLTQDEAWAVLKALDDQGKRISKAVIRRMANKMFPEVRSRRP